MERQDKVVLTLDSYEHGIMIRALNELRNDLLEEQRDPRSEEHTSELQSLSRTTRSAIFTAPTKTNLLNTSSPI